MTDDRIKEAEAEAKRFLRCAIEVRKRIRADAGHPAYQMKETAALRRASMDLTRALARLRKVEA